MGAAWVSRSAPPNPSSPGLTSSCPGAQPGLYLRRSLQSPALSPAAILGHCPLSLSALPLPAPVVPRHLLLPLAAPTFSPCPSLALAGPGSARKPELKPDAEHCEVCVCIPTLSLSVHVTLAGLFPLRVTSPSGKGHAALAYLAGLLGGWQFPREPPRNLILAQDPAPSRSAGTLPPQLDCHIWSPGAGTWRQGKQHICR